jgi:hypothetical protein
MAASPSVKASPEQRRRDPVREFSQAKVTRMEHTVRNVLPFIIFNSCHAVSTVRTMICLHPYNTWPLHVKLFTENAVKHWEDAANIPPLAPLPRGFTCQIELEGVDGKSGLVGSGRKGPISITDGVCGSLVSRFAPLLTSMYQQMNSLVRSSQKMRPS